jgi:uncharacterized membrane protein YdjX (TVP38/TMEM64 family)/1-acyl-sn-glycerol-3-phosphate acyltransferase
MMKKSNLKFKIFSAFFLAIVLVLLTVFLFSGENRHVLNTLFDTDQTKEQVQEKLSSLGLRGHIVISILAMLQVLLSILPAEPIQVIAGVSFGFPIGLACCMLGVFVGNSLIYLLYRIFGDRLRQFFDKALKIDLEKAGKSGRVTLLIFILYFLPAIPYGMICFFACTMKMKYSRYITVTLLGSLPSVCIGVGLGQLAIGTSWILSIIVFAVLLLLLLIAFLFKDKLFGMLNDRIDKTARKNPNVVRPYHRFKLSVLYVFSRIIFFFKGVKVRYVKKVDQLQTPCIVLCNHGSFIDFAYAGTLIRETSPNFVVARLYFYKKLVNDFIRSFGCFPKSMFTLDLDSVKNCLRVLKNGGVLAMMPEARLSTVGKFEDIQKETFAFLKSAGVPVYTVMIHGDYLAKPKWGGKMRRGALVESTLEQLFTAEELKLLSREEIEEKTLAALYYDEFEWLATHPELHYRTRKFAEGLENILTICPKCHARHSFTAKGHTLRCEACDYTATLTDRYAFTEKAPFANFAEWYDWQRAELARAIEADPDFALTSPVVLKHSSKDGKTMLRVAGKGVCTLNRQGLTYKGTRDGEEVEKLFPLSSIYRILFGAGEDFEIYEGKEIFYFCPEEPRSCVDYYIVSGLLKENFESSLSQKGEQHDKALV